MNGHPDERRDSCNRHLLQPRAYLPGLGEIDSTPIIVRGEGVYIHNEDGNRLLDGTGGMRCMQTSQGRRGIADTVAEQIETRGSATDASALQSSFSEYL